MTKLLTLPKSKTLLLFLILISLVFVYFFFFGNKVTKTYAAPQTVCFCHNLTHNPVTICTSNAGLINGHLAHVNSGTDSLGVCPTKTPAPSSTPTASPTATPTASPT